MRWWGLAILLSVLFATVAFAEADTFGVGTGRDGPFTASSFNSLVINQCWVLVAGADAGSTAVQISGATTPPLQTLVMFHQTIGVTDPGVPDASVLSYATDNVGRWELARVASFSGGTLGLTAPLVNGFNVPGTQIVQVPEYTSMTLQAFSQIRPLPWNGSCGGLVAALVAGTVDSTGDVTADGLGLRGGPSNGVSFNTGCIAHNEPGPAGARKGEGLVYGIYGATSTGWGSTTSGAGGGDCRNSGGGGGGNAGAGGQGGNTDLSDGDRPFGGRGGTAITANLPAQILFGGGAGAGEQDEGQDPRGGNGGGAIFIRALQFTGVGRYSASGEQGPTTAGGGIGSGGGGAGGTVVMFSTSDLGCGRIQAVGADGGSSTNGSGTGPGGGGGGGRVFIMAPTVGCAVLVEGGVAGAFPGPLPYHNAEPTVAARDGGQGQGLLVSVFAPFDGGASSLGGGPDGGSGADGGSGSGPLHVGCGCGAMDQSLLLVFGMALLVLPLSRRRARQRGIHSNFGHSAIKSALGAWPS